MRYVIEIETGNTKALHNLIADLWEKGGVVFVKTNVLKDSVTPVQKSQPRKKSKPRGRPTKAQFEETRKQIEELQRQGYTNAQIAEKMGIQPGTVTRHLDSLRIAEVIAENNEKNVPEVSTPDPS